jgi:hypothetical protein
MPSNSRCLFHEQWWKRLYRTVLDFLPSARDVLHGAKAFNDANSACQYLLIKYWIRNILIVLSTKKKMFTATGQLTITWRICTEPIVRSRKSKRKIRDFESDVELLISICYKKKNSYRDKKFFLTQFSLAVFNMLSLCFVLTVTFLLWLII